MHKNIKLSDVQQSSTVEKTPKSMSAVGTYSEPFDVCGLARIPVYKHNGLPKSIFHFKNIPMPNIKNYVVAYYGDTDSTMGSNIFTNYLFIEDFDTLSQKQWLSNFVIDICVRIMISTRNDMLEPDRNIKSLSSEFVVMFFNSKTKIGTITNDSMTTLDKHSLLILPINIRKKHWIVAFLDYTKSTCTIMDPMKPYSKNSMHFKRVISVVSNTCEFVSGDSNENVQFPTLKLVPCAEADVKQQQDEHNCGIFVLYYISTVINRTAFNKHFNPKAFRLMLKKYIVQNSMNMTNICLYCGECKNKHTNTQWVHCAYCCRWTSVRCIPPIYRSDDYTNDSFVCLLCQEYV